MIVQRLRAGNFGRLLDHHRVVSITTDKPTLPVVIGCRRVVRLLQCRAG